MLVIPGQAGKDLCDSHLGVTRRELLQVGGSSMLGLSLAALSERRGHGEGSGQGVGQTYGQQHQRRAGVEQG